MNTGSFSQVSGHRAQAQQGSAPSAVKKQPGCIAVDSGLQPIRSEAEYRAALSQIGTIFESGKVLPSDSAEWNHISALLALIDAWEQSGDESEPAEAGISFEPAASRKAAAMTGSFARSGQAPQPASGQRARAAPEIRSLRTDLRFAPTAA